jgi:hypothetical protein
MTTAAAQRQHGTRLGALQARLLETLADGASALIDCEQALAGGTEPGGCLLQLQAHAEPRRQQRLAAVVMGVQRWVRSQPNWVAEQECSLLRAEE